MDKPFEEAVSLTKKFTTRPSNEELLKLYALFKQSTEGDVQDERPGGFDFKAIAKYDAWQQLKGKPTQDAQSEYVVLVTALSEKYL
ncbi:MAG: acyl-CoA-binding protein [Bacteroidota bacterium]